MGHRNFHLPVRRGLQPSGKNPVFDLHSTYEEIPEGGIPGEAEGYNGSDFRRRARPGSVETRKWSRFPVQEQPLVVPWKADQLRR